MEWNAITIGFVVFTILTLGGGMGVVTTRNLFRGTIWLMVSLFGVAGYMVLLSAPFLAAVQILVYIGAIAILITFAVMLTRSVTRISQRYIRTLPSLIGALVLFLILTAGVTIPIFGGQTPDVAATVATTSDFGAALVDGNGYVVPFMLASLLLTAAMIGAIFIARDEDEQGGRSA